MQSRDTWALNGSNRSALDDLVTAFAEIERLLYQRFDSDDDDASSNSSGSEDILNAAFLYLRYKTDFFDRCESQKALAESVMGVLKSHSDYHFVEKPAMLGERIIPPETPEADPEYRDYRIKGTLESTETLIKLFDNMETYDRIWITPDACICRRLRSWHRPSSDLKHGVGVNVDHDLRSKFEIHIRGTCPRALVEGLNLVFALPGGFSLDVTNECETSLSDIRPFLSSNATNEMFLRDGITLTREDGLALANCSRINELRFGECSFEEDGGVSYIEEALERNTFPQEFRFEGHCPFAANVISRFLTSLPEETTLCMEDLTFRNDVVPVPNIKALDMADCAFEDGGYMALPEAIGANRGPKSLVIHCSDEHPPGGLQRMLGSSERCLSFMRALRTNSRLRSLVVACDTDELDTARIVTELAHGLQTNQGLRSLDVDFCDRYGDLNSCACWKDLFESLSTHPMLQSIRFHSIYVDELPVSDLRSNQLRAVATYAAEMLQVNHQIERVSICTSNICDRKIFDNKVTPVLQVNILRKRLLKFREAHVEPKVRAALLARIMGGSSCSSNPSLVWLTLQHNQASVVQHLLAPRRRVSPRRRKRRRIGGRIEGVTSS